jgi:hypothetical protein
MPRLPASLLALGLATVAAVGLTACGEESAKLLPGETAREITANLESVKQLANEGDCVGAASAAGQVSEQIEALNGIDRRLKQALESGAQRLGEVVAGCEESTTEAVAPAEEPSEGAAEERHSKALEREAKQEERAERKEAPPETEEKPASPQPPGKAKGLENGNGPPQESGEEAAPEESTSGGVGPGAPVGGGN